MTHPERGIDIGLYTTAEVLADKLDQGEGGGDEATWNMKRLPVRLGQGSGPDRLYFAHGGSWRGYFRIVPEVLLNPDDEEKPYSLIFDVTSWKEVDPIPVKRFRGFRYLQDMPE